MSSLKKTILTLSLAPIHLQYRCYVPTAYMYIYLRNDTRYGHSRPTMEYE